ncbi:MAG: hypothetical protein HQL11_05290 [Candidatus Omnitrophica bacterium]|nr:hypothetical protein [Candidatus Omnitrophota bacterium]
MKRAGSSGLSKEVAEAAGWLVRSGIQNRSGRPQLDGGVSAWYEMYRKRYPFLYSEITGYAITCFLFLNNVDPRPQWVNAARRAATWLMRKAWHPCGGVHTRYYLVKNYQSPNYSFHTGRVYAFDTGMVAYGMLRLHRLSPRKMYREYLDQAHAYLTRQLDITQPDFYPYWDKSTGRKGRDTGKWSDQNGTFHGKCAMFLIDYARESGRAGDRDACLRLLDWVLDRQEDDGRFVTNVADGSTHLHPHCYTLEGLLYGAAFLGKDKYLKAAIRGARWMRQAVSDSGSVSAIYEHEGFAHYERSDIVAQVLRIGSILHAWPKTPNVFDEKILTRIREHLLMFQFNEEGPQKGGFFYGADTDGRLRIHLNAWASMFSLQALWMHERFVRRGRPVDLECLV